MIVVRVRLQSTPEERFLAQITAIRRQIDALPEAAVGMLVDDLERLRRQVLGEIAAATLESFQAARLSQLEGRLRAVMDEFAARYGATLAPIQQQAYQAGAELAASPLVEAGVMFHVPQISRRQLEVLQGFQAALITGVTDETIRAITTQLRLGTIRGESVPDLLGRVSGRLTDPGPFGSLATRAEAITRTELGRIQAIATQAGLEETQRFVPDLRKEWRHSGNTGPNRRIGHVTADGQTRAVTEPFRVRAAPGRPYEALMYPRDAGASPENSVFCGCQALPWRAEWADILGAAA